MADYQHILSNHLGFTLIEMMIVITIMGILATVAYPSMQQKIAQMKVQNAANLLESNLKQARADALVYHAPVTIVATSSRVNFTQLGNTTTNNNYPKTLAFDKNITLSGTMSTTLTPTKNATGTPASVGFCYTGVSTDKYVVTVDAISNISSENVSLKDVSPAKKGSCL